MSVDYITKLVDLFTHDLCDYLAMQLHIKTGHPIYAIYDPTEPPCKWGIDYWHYCIKIKEDCYFNARGFHTEEEMKLFWAEAWKEPELLYNSELVPHTPALCGTGDPFIDQCMTNRYGDPNTIQPHTIQFADLLIKTYAL